MKPLQFYLRNLRIPNPSNSKQNKFTKNQDQAPLKWFLRIPSRFYPKNPDQQARFVYVASKSTWYPLARPNILVKSNTKKPPRFYPRNRNLKSTGQNSKRNRFTKNRVTSILPSKSTPFETSIPPLLFSLRNEKRKKKTPPHYPPRYLALVMILPSTNQPSRNRQTASKAKRPVERRRRGAFREVCVCVCVCVYVCVCVCMCAWMRACLSRAAFLDKVWLTAADALAAPSPFTASPWTHTPHSASILIGGGRVPRDFYVSHRATTTATHVRTHVRLPLSNFRYVHVDRWLWAWDGFAGNGERALALASP